MRIATGLDRLLSDDFRLLKGKTVGLVCNQASVSHNYRHVLDLFMQGHREGSFRLQAAFGPQHGLYGHTQDNMVEWEPDEAPSIGVPIHSLYGRHREPTPEMLAGIEVLVVDLQDVGARYYTFLWTLALCMKACSALAIQVLVLDRPNPIGGLQVEGTLLDPSYSSFVGMFPIPTRYGLTIGEIARHFNQNYYPDCQLDVVELEGWERRAYLDEADAPWAMPSPNMPTVDSAVVYPGGCLLEGTNISEGRGTTRPFEIVGASYVDGWRLADSLCRIRLPGAHFRALQFEPKYSKDANKICEGVFVHVLDRPTFEPVLTFVAVIQEVLRQAPKEFEWKSPPYEYEYEKLPIDILAGNSWLRKSIEDLTGIDRIRERFKNECTPFESARRECMIYR